MIFRRYILLGVIGLLILGFVINFYFVRMLINNSSFKSTWFQNNGGLDLQSELNSSSLIILRIVKEKIAAEMKILPSRYFKQNTKYTRLLENILQELEMSQVEDDKIPDILKNWPNVWHLIPPSAPELGTIIHFLRSSQIIKADNAKLGTQLKLMLTFENGLKAIFKPQWYNRTTKIIGPVYYGKDRHNAEVVAFHLSLLLSFRRVPLAFIRKVKLKEEILSNATPELLSTMYEEGGNTCFYGICHYCSPADPVCGNDNVLEGSIILWLPSKWKLVKYKNPWQRTYTKNRNALWEVDMNFCDKIKQSKTYSIKGSNKLLNLIDTAIFDFLIDNGDRHHYELFQGNFKDPSILLIDNGKSFGNPDIDHIDILAPLYQCCMIHKTTWERLQLLSGGALSHSLRKLLSREAFMANTLPIITKDHLEAIDRRLLTVFAIVEICLKNNKHVIV